MGGKEKRRESVRRRSREKRREEREEREERERERRGSVRSECKSKRRKRMRERKSNGRCVGRKAMDEPVEWKRESTMGLASRRIRPDMGRVIRGQEVRRGQARLISHYFVCLVEVST